jgi:hypothetical protein
MSRGKCPTACDAGQVRLLHTQTSPPNTTNARGEASAASASAGPPRLSNKGLNYEQSTCGGIDSIWQNPTCAWLRQRK